MYLHGVDGHCEFLHFCPPVNGESCVFLEFTRVSHSLLEFVLDALPLIQSTAAPWIVKRPPRESAPSCLS